MLTQTTVKERLLYNPDTGVFTNIKPIGGVKLHSTAGYLRKDGYCGIKILGKEYLVHRIAYLYMTGNFPTEQIDHINRIPSDNRWCNLRAVTQNENQINRPIQRNNSSGYKGVSYHKRDKIYQVSVGNNKKQLYLGSYESLEEAVKVRDDYCRLHHGEFYSGIGDNYASAK